MVPARRPARSLLLLAALVVAGCSGDSSPDRRPVDEASKDAPRRSQGLESKPMDAPPPPPTPVQPAPEPEPEPEPEPAPATQPEATPETPPPAPAAEPTKPAAEAPPAEELKHWVEYWEGTKTPKFKYEMRKGANGRWARNGFAQAFYQTGAVEREGQYKDNKRVGIWTYFRPDGTVLRTEDRGEGNEPDTSK